MQSHNALLQLQDIYIVFNILFKPRNKQKLYEIWNIV